MFLQEARAVALEHRKHLAGGEDPIDARRAARSAGATFGQAAKAYIDSHRVGWKNDAQADQWAQSLRDYGPAGSLPIEQVDTALLMACLKQICSTKTETATRLRSRIERVLDWAKFHGLARREQPSALARSPEEPAPKPSKVKPKRHHAAMPFIDVPAFMARLPERDAKS